MNEADLFRAHAKPAREKRRCACRGELIADPLDTEEIGAAIRADRLTERHQAWRQRMIESGLLLDDAELAALQPTLRRVG